MKRGPRMLVAFLRHMFNIFLNWRVTGQEHVPLDGPLVVVCNHVHLVDPLLLISAFPRWITYMAKEELFHYPVIGAILRWSEVFPVARGGAIEQKRDVMRKSEALLREGHALALFPEGKRDRTGVLLRGKPGAGVLASHTGALLLPVVIRGTESLTGISWLWKRPRIELIIGHPVALPPTEGHISRSTATALTEEVMARIAELLPPDKRGPYAG